MSKKLNVTGYHVVVNPRRLGNFGMVHMSDAMAGYDEERALKKYRSLCEDIVADIKRHCDDVGDAEVVTELESVCEHCGASWTEASTIYNGGCCDKDCDGETLAQQENMIAVSKL